MRKGAIVFLTAIISACVAFFIGYSSGFSNGSKRADIINAPRSVSISSITSSPVRQSSLSYTKSPTSTPRRTNTPKPTSTPKKVTYVLNTRSKKFHKPSCASVEQMNFSNREDVNLSRDKIISMGYDPCGRCHP